MSESGPTQIGNLKPVIASMGLEVGQPYAVRVQAMVKRKWRTVRVLRSRWPELPMGTFMFKQVTARYWRLLCTPGSK